METILVTGGAGFIGSHVARKLIATGRKVRVLDNFDPFYDVAIKRRNVEVTAAAAPPGTFEAVEGDFRDREVAKRVTADVDGIIHLGALAGVRPSIQDPVRYMDVNVTGTQILLSAIQDRPGIPFVCASSSSVYGGNTKVPFAEDDPVDHPVSPYAASKKACEVVCYTHHHLYGHPVTMLRFFTVYGPGQRPEMAIHLFSRKILAGETVPMFGDGTTRRDYTYVDDIVDGVVAALERASGYRIYNIGGSRTTELKTLIGLLGEVLDREVRIEQLPEQPGDVKQTWADPTRIEQELGFRPRIEIRDGLERFAAWYLAERKAGRLA